MRVVRPASLLGITVTGLVYVVVPAPTDHRGLQVWTNAGEHYISPVLTILGSLTFGRPPADNRRRRRLGTAVAGGMDRLHARPRCRQRLVPLRLPRRSALGYAVAMRNLALVVLLALVLLLVFWLVDRSLPARGREPVSARPAASEP
jgi:hypothetical protein